jgi:sec-independent protein translocase protein TatC
VPDILDTVRTGVSERAELPGMSLIQHLEELRRRIIHSFVYIAAGFFLAYWKHDAIYGFMQKPIVKALQKHHLDTQLVYHNPIDPFNLYLKVSFVGGIILASPFVLYQVWLFISPGLYKHEKRYVVPFMTATVGLFLAGAWFGYRYVFAGALDFLLSYSSQFKALIEINEYTDLFETVILGLGIVFEMPILVFFLALFGIISADFMWRNFRYAILIIFIIAGIIAPPDVLSMCIFASPMLVLYIISIGVAYMVHPGRRKRLKEAAK